ncbi:MAG: hypothetical protein B6245_02665 [Desulfobacteraceae bacterium 4572_88]|nr:MAG: hypothetical protein B6245_02665 [Desulfobacteraceae bacterium 4572_88]
MTDATCYGLFDTYETLILGEKNTSDLFVLSETTYEADLSEISPDGESRWFHVAPVDNSVDNAGDIGPTTTDGPYLIDTI